MSKYARAHDWIHSNDTKTGVCEHCSAAGVTEWSNRSGEYLEMRDDWQELCLKCHRRYDRQPHMRGARYRAGINRPTALLQFTTSGSEDNKTIERFRKYAKDYRSFSKALKILLDKANIA